MTKGIIFDCDGVLVDSERISSRVFATLMRDYGASISDDQVHYSLKGSSIHTSLEFAAQHVSDFNPESFEKEYREKSYMAFRQEMQPISGVRKILDLNHPKCVASNGPKSKIILNLKLSGLDHYFSQDKVISAHDFQEFKPEPDLYLRAAKILQLPPADCVVIEDSAYGAEAAYRAGIPCYGFTADTDPEEFVRHSAIPFSSMEELYNHLIG